MSKREYPIPLDKLAPPAHHGGELIYFYPNNDWEITGIACHDSDGAAYDQSGTALYTGIVVSHMYVYTSDCLYFYDVLCGDGKIRRMKSSEVYGISKG